MSSIEHFHQYPDFYENTFEPIRQRSKVGTRPAPKKHGAHNPKIAPLRREIGMQDTNRVRGFLRQIFEQNQLILGPDIEFTGKPGVSTCSSRDAQTIYDSHYRSGFGLRSAKRFNYIINSYAQEINDSSENIFAQVGGFAIFGVQNERLEGMRFIGATLKGTENELLREENDGLMRRLIPDYDLPMLQDFARRNQPHISFAKTMQYDTAIQVRDVLNASELSQMWVQLKEASN